MISPLAYVDASAKLGNNVIVHPFAYIDKNVEIGDNCEIMPYASVLSGTRMGKGNRVFQHAVWVLNHRISNTKVAIHYWSSVTIM